MNIHFNYLQMYLIISQYMGGGGGGGWEKNDLAFTLNYNYCFLILSTFHQENNLF